MSTEQLVIWAAVAYLVLMLAYSYIRSLKIHAWPYVVGKLQDADVDYLHMVDRYSAWDRVSYEYEVDGEKYIGKRLSPLIVRGQVASKIKKQLAKIEYVSKDQVKVFYDKKDPSKSYLVKETWFDIFR